MQPTLDVRKQIILSLTGLLLLSLLGLALRHVYLQRMILHADEFTSLLGVKMTLDKGIPIYPSQIFEGKGITFSYLGAAASMLFSFSIQSIRYMTMAISVLTIPLVYWTALKLFNNRWAAVLAAVMITLHPMAILWGARARMYSMATAGIFLIIAVSWLSLAWRKTKPAYLALVPLVVLVTLLTHLVVIINLPALGLALVVVYWLGTKPSLKQPKDWGWLGLVLASIGLVTAFGSWVGRQPGEIRQWQAEASLMSDIQTAILGFGLLDNIDRFFLDPENLVATLFSLIGVVGLIAKIRRSVLTKTDLAAIFVYLQLIVTFVILYVFVPSNVRDSRHNFIVLLPFLILAMSYGALMTVEFMRPRLPGRYAAPVLYSIILIGIAGPLAPEVTTLLYSGPSNTYRYDQAMARINARHQPNDQLLAVLPPSTYLFDAPADFYANQHKPRFAQQPDTGRLIDYYTGSQYLPSVEEFNSAIDQPGKLWFAVDDTRFVRNYEPRFSQEVLHQMQPVERVGNITIFKERNETWPMAAAPDVELAADFSNQLHLVGYAAKLAGSDLRLTFFWKPVDPIFHYKVFVHLRDQSGNTVTQADFAPYDNIVHMSQWLKTWGNEAPVATGTILPLPPEILGTDPGQYRLFVGLYAPEFNRRVPLAGDTSGENAVILTELGLKEALTESQPE